MNNSGWNRRYFQVFVPWNTVWVSVTQNTALASVLHKQMLCMLFVSAYCNGWHVTHTHVRTSLILVINKRSHTVWQHQRFTQNIHNTFNPFASRRPCIHAIFFSTACRTACKHTFRFLRVFPEAVSTRHSWLWQTLDDVYTRRCFAESEGTRFGAPGQKAQPVLLKFQAQICKDGFIIHCLWCLSGMLSVRPGAGW